MFFYRAYGQTKKKYWPCKKSKNPKNPKKRGFFENFFLWQEGKFRNSGKGVKSGFKKVWLKQEQKKLNQKKIMSTFEMVYKQPEAEN